ncbi:choice-of-anchor J domain-containing protein [Porphyromonas loveana]|uniref:choice-of-anchor J domain-containing protein n=1 Tax=Porphyromonas loveana TaxID=1884669 RepID=UPI0035A15F09
MRKISSFFSAALVLAFFGFGQKAVAQGMTFPYTEGFEGSIPDTWAIQDADGDTWSWLHSATGTYQTAHTGTGMAASFSWSGGHSLNPDNWLISPDITGATKMRYFVSVNDLYPNEHYAVMVRVAGQEEFTVLFSETLSKGRAQSEWYERSVDLPAGAMQIAFRHYNCSGQNYLRLDDVEFTNGSGPVNLNPVQNLSGTMDGNGRVVLTWDAPALAKAAAHDGSRYADYLAVLFDDVTFGGEHRGKAGYSYTVYRDGLEVAGSLTATTYIEENVTGSHEYCVEVQYAAGTSPQECVTLSPGSVESIFVPKPYTLTIVGNAIIVACQGEAMIYDMNGRRLAADREVVVYEAQTGIYAVMIVVDDKSYVEKVAVK